MTHRRRKEERKKRKEEKDAKGQKVEEEDKGKKANPLLGFIIRYVHFFILAGIIAGAVGLRWVTADFNVLLDADPWWFYRHAQEIYDGNFRAPAWDIQSYYPAGRPVTYYLGWSYTIAIFYAITHAFSPDMTLMKFSGLFVPFFASLSAIPAYFVGAMITNRWGGLTTAVFAVVSPIFMALSMAGYPDSDVVVVFYSFLAVLTTLYAIRRAEGLELGNAKSSCKELAKYIPHLLPAVVAYWLFAVSWNYSWYIFFMFLFFIPLLIIFRLLEAVIFRRQKGNVHLIYEKIRENRGVVMAIVLIGLLGELVSLLTNFWPYNIIPLHHQLVAAIVFLKAGILGATIFAALIISVGAILGLGVGKLRGLFVGAAVSAVIPIVLLPSALTGQPSIVNISIAELVPLSILSSAGFIAIVQKLGGVPFLLGVIGIIALIIFKLITKREISKLEFFALTWIIISLILINAGARFSLLFTIAIATAAGLLVGSLVESLGRRRKRSALALTVYVLIIAAVLVNVNDSFNFMKVVANQIQISDDWVDALTWLKENAGRDALVVTWWDSGHLIAGFTGLRIHSDGAHCTKCIPYNHDIRIVDMGKIWSTTDENESVNIIRKYDSLPSAQCDQVRKRFGSIVPEDACNAPSEIYLLASRDLIDKYSWISYFGSFDYESGSGEHRNYRKLFLSGKDGDGNLVYGNEITLKKQNEELIPYIDIPTRGIKNQIIEQMVSYDEQGKEITYDYSDSPNVMNGLVLVPQGGQYVIFMEPEVRDSMLTKLFFFDGSDLQHFELVFGNSEVKIYKVNL
jgi:hypothetical protein